MFTVGAAHPDVTEDPEQGMFFVLGLEANPAGLSYTLVPQTPVSGVIVLSNRSELTVNGLTAELVPSDFI